MITPASTCWVGGASPWRRSLPPPGGISRTGARQPPRLRWRSTAEVTLALYRAIREAAGDVTLIGCNTFGHLGAGLFELQRTGDDTSGRDFHRTRRMGVNTLAFRAPQHGAFFALDADCAPITPDVPWEFASRWLDLVARSGALALMEEVPVTPNAGPVPAVLDPFTPAPVESLALPCTPKSEPVISVVSVDWPLTPIPRAFVAVPVTPTADPFPDTPVPAELVEIPDTPIDAPPVLFVAAP